MGELGEEITAADQERFEGIVSEKLADWQQRQILEPVSVFPRQEAVLAVHWHPEFVPLALIEKRLKAMFPGSGEELVIPTQHNEFVSYRGFTGAEIDCYSKGFNRKVQLLLHFPAAKVTGAATLKSILHHTFKYRSSQLFEFMHAVTRPALDIVDAAARETGAAEDLIEFTRVNVLKIERLIDAGWSSFSQRPLKNKLLRDWFDALRPEIGDAMAGRIQFYLNAVKKRVKARFSLKYFYRASEVIEETRGLGGGVVIPHPEQFWPILLADYDVDGIEVWNPQSREYTEFLISVVGRKNRQRRTGERAMLIFMGDDCHMGEKTKPRAAQDPEKSGREIGLQPAWDDLDLQKKLIMQNVSRRTIIAQYKERLAG
ncbi:MAG: hypothetical protein HQK81_06795 [Desulfovibrionaceae bacterium]|nr:hypothetical protein [Desulfovibrionaceae bacterium]MBF0513758.1 hypothetical protein [Desulfovibrionaceae bacterium]